MWRTQLWTLEETDGGDGKRKPRVQEDGSVGQQRGWYLGSGENLASQEMGGRGRGGGPYVKVMRDYGATYAIK